jgi:hypothetical protein
MTIYDEVQQHLGKPESEVRIVPTTSVKYAVGSALATYEVHLTPLKRLSYKHSALICAGVNPHSGEIYLHIKPCDSLEQLEQQLQTL